mmetsp:Transcript_29072/g.72842  ORF Transcript_29072/g.72842 Transcript_29072/m.72842 type:complete len:202 (+) Transcript_29072:563-1168(+)
MSPPRRALLAPLPWPAPLFPAPLLTPLAILAPHGMCRPAHRVWTPSQRSLGAKFPAAAALRITGREFGMLFLLGFLLLLGLLLLALFLFLCLLAGLVLAWQNSLPWRVHDFKDGACFHPRLICCGRRALCGTDHCRPVLLGLFAISATAGGSPPLLLLFFTLLPALLGGGMVLHTFHLRSLLLVVIHMLHTDDAPRHAAAT